MNNVKPSCVRHNRGQIKNKTKVSCIFFLSHKVRSHFRRHNEYGQPDMMSLVVKGELWRKMNLWSNKTSVSSQSFSEICSHDNRM